MIQKEKCEVAFDKALTKEKVSIRDKVFRDPTFFLITVSSYERRTVIGKLYCSPFAPITFQGLDQLLLLMDLIMDKGMDASKQVIYPQAYYEKRSLKKADTQNERLNLRRSTADWNCVVSSVLQTPNSFTIKVLYRQNGSMQGMLFYKKDSYCFRSGLELIRYIYQVLEDKYIKEK